MRKIYLDYEFKCYPSDLGTITPVSVETDFFDGKCDGFVMGYRFIPEGESWTDDYGNVFRGEMIFPWVSDKVLENAQREYEIADAENALAILFGGETV
jgi:hypothetical protein